MHSASIRSLAFVLGLTVLNCSAADKVQNKVTCSSVCNRYKDCFDNNYDVGKCTDSCAADANTNADKDRQLNQCNDCIDGQSCTGAAFSCTTECAGIVAQ